MLRDVVRMLLTESDNRTHDLFRYLALCSIITGLALAVYSVVWKSQPFDMQTFGIGVGSLLAGVGVAIGLKKEGAQP